MLAYSIMVKVITASSFVLSNQVEDPCPHNVLRQVVQRRNLPRLLKKNQKCSMPGN